MGLEQYAPAFRDNDIDGNLLRRLTAEDLRELSVSSIGHRRSLLDSIAALGVEAPAVVTAASREIPAQPNAERRQLTVMFCDLVGSTALSAFGSPRTFAILRVMDGKLVWAGQSPSTGLLVAYSCRASQCGSCKITLLKGSVEHNCTGALTPDDEKEGHILAWQARPMGRVVVDL